MSLIGTHIGKRKTLYETVNYCVEGNLQTFQFYLANSRGYAINVPSDTDLVATRELLSRHPGTNVFVHTCLLYNLNGKVDIDTNPSSVSKGEEMLNLTIDGLITELDILAAIVVNNKSGAVLHTGSGKDKTRAYQRVINSINEVLSCEGPHTVKLAKAVGLKPEELVAKRRLVLEICAGEGNKIGSSIDELKIIVQGVDTSIRTKENLKICIDTAHLHSWGDWNLNEPFALVDFFEIFEKELGREMLSCIHLNDSKVPFGARKDRHEAIGYGTIFGGESGADSLEEIVRVIKEWQVPAIMELPVQSQPYVYLLRGIYERLN